MPKISELTEATSVSPTDEVAIVQSGATKRVDASELVTYARTAEEISASVTPTDYAYPPGHAWRYGMDPDAASNTAAFDTAVTACQAGGYELFIPSGNYRFTTRPAAITDRLTIHGEAKGKVVLYRNYTEATATAGFITISPTVEIASCALRNLLIYADTGTSGGTGVYLGGDSDAQPDGTVIADCIISGLSGATWAHPIYADGSARLSPLGLRQLFLQNCTIFNGNTSNATFKSVVNAWITGCGFFSGSGTSNNVVITGTSDVKSQNIVVTGGYLEDIDLDYARHTVITAASPVQAITNTANVDYTLIFASYHVSCETDWDADTCALITPNRIYRSQVTVSADRGDSDRTLTAGTDEVIQRFATTLSGNRTVTLSTTGAVAGDRFRVVRTGLGAFTLDVGGLKTIPSATAAFVDVSYNGSAWVLTGYGAL